MVIARQRSTRMAWVAVLALAAVAVAWAVDSTAGAATLAAAVAGLGVARPRIAVALLLVLFAFHPLAMRIAQVDIGVSGSALVLLSAWKEVALAAVLARTGWDVVAAMRRGGVAAPVRLHALDALALALLVLLAGFVVAQPTPPALNAARLLAFPVGVFAAIRLDRLPGRRPDYLALMVWSGATVAAMGVLQTSLLGWEFVTRYWGTPALPIPYTFTSLYLEGPRASATLSSPVEFATIAAALVPCAVAILLCRREGLAIPGLALATLVLGTGLSFARSSVVAAGVAIVVVLLAAYRTGLVRRPNARVLAVALAAPILLGLVVYVDRGGIMLIASTFTTIAGEPAAPTAAPPGDEPVVVESPPPDAPPVDDPSTVAHVTSIREGVALVLANPAGVGLGNVGARVVPGSDVRPAYFAESWYLTMGLSLGWLGLAWAVAFTVALAIAGLRAIGARSSRAGLGLLGIAPVVAIVGLLLPTFMEPQVMLIPWAVAALAIDGSHEPRCATASPTASTE